MAGPHLDEETISISCVTGTNNMKSNSTGVPPSIYQHPEGINTEEFVSHLHCNNNKDIEKGITRRIRHKHRPLYRRIYNYVREAWIGVRLSAKSDCELEELEAQPRYRPDSLSALCQATRFSEAEIKRIYRGFKSECPTGVIKEDAFKIIYAQFFPQGGWCANTGLYAHYVFNTLDKDHTGILSFENFVQGLSILSRGTLEEKLCWTFNLYDINDDGRITRDEMTDIVTAIYELTGQHNPEVPVEDDKIKDRVDRLFQKMDMNRDGVITIDEFLDSCRKDQTISRSMCVFDSTI